MIPVRLCMWGMTHTLGVQGGGTPRANPAPMGPAAFLSLAAGMDLGGVEITPEFVSPKLVPSELQAYRADADGRGLGITVCAPGLDAPRPADGLRLALEAAGHLGARHVRTTLSKILCGERKLVGGLGGWRSLLRDAAKILREVAPEAESRGMRIAVENHQDATSWDLLELAEAAGSPAVGVTLDTGNPLAVGEDIMRFARRVLPRLVNVHLKDYRMFATASGYRLVRCPLGEGIVPFPELLALFSAEAPGATLSLELAALDNRHIRALEDDWWEGIGPRDAREFLPVLKLMRERAETGEYRTPWELGRDAELTGYEMDQVTRSARYLRTQVAGMGA